MTGPDAGRDREPLMVSTTYRVAGMATPADARAVKDSLSAVPEVGGVATEIHPEGESVVILKHTDDAELDRSALEAAVRAAGPYTLS